MDTFNLLIAVVVGGLFCVALYCYIVGMLATTSGLKTLKFYRFVFFYANFGFSLLPGLFSIAFTTLCLAALAVLTALYLAALLPWVWGRVAKKAYKEFN